LLRAQQVTIMSIIYRMARRVLIWLGNDDWGVLPAIELILAMRTQSLKDLGDLDAFIQYSNPYAYKAIGEFPAREIHWQSIRQSNGRARI
jgi:hypothetical protein